jgi:hypothetical protein
MCCAGEVNINLTGRKLKPTCVRTILRFAEIVSSDFMFFEIFHNKNAFKHIYVPNVFISKKRKKKRMHNNCSLQKN